MEIMNEFAIGEDSLTGEIIGAAIEVHKHLGPGLLESAYEACLHYELSRRDFLQNLVDFLSFSLISKNPL